LVYVVPNFAGEGYFSRQLIPEQLGLTGRVTKIGGRKIIYCDPVGSHPAIADLVQDHGLDLCELNLLRPEQTALLMIRHGSPRAGEADAMSGYIADSIRKAGRFAEVVTTYIEQEPFVADWPSLLDSPTVIATPMLVGDGHHASLQLPPLFNLTRPDGGPVSVAGRTVWLTPSLWHDPGMVDIALDLVASADREAERLERRRAFG
jgi:sirohydrochlorin cobaltochelatase